MSILQQHHYKILWVMISLFIIIFSALAIWKYLHFGYNAMDLGIINQVFFNTAQGRFFASSIQGGSYLGDHVELIILLLLPFYFIAQSPITLLLLQIILLALAAVPLYLIGKKIFDRPEHFLILPLIYLLNPFIHNITVFEFHLLPLALPILLFAFYFYLEKKFWPWFSCLALALLVREDVSFAVFSFGLFILLEDLLDRRPIRWRWVLTPLMISATYFWAALTLSAHFSPSGQYKFLIYYSWLGETLPQAMTTLLTNPLGVLAHLLRYKNLEMMVALLLPFLFLPLARARYLLLAFGTFLQLTISDIGGSFLIVQLHYATLLIVPLFIATGYGLKKILAWPRIKMYGSLPIWLLLLATVYSIVALGFGQPRVTRPELTGVKEALVNAIPANAAVAASYEFLPMLSNRQQLSSLNYHFLGRKQLSRAAYQLPEDTEYILADLSETITYQMQYQGLRFYRDDYFQGAARLRSLLTEQHFSLEKIVDTIALFKKNAPTKTELYTITEQTPRDSFTCAPTETFNFQLSTFNFSCSLQFTVPPADNYQLEWELKQDGKVVSSRLLPIAYGFYTTSELQPNQLLTTNYQLSAISYQFNQTCVRLVHLTGALGLNRFGQTYNYIEKKDILKTLCF